MELTILNELLKQKNNNKLKLYFSNDFNLFLKRYNTKPNLLLSKTFEKYDICYVNTSNILGFVQILPSSKYLQILKNYKKENKMNDEWIDNIKNNFTDFYTNYNQKEIIDKNIQTMKSGRFINNTLHIPPYDVESFVIKYKHYQKLNK